MVSALYPGSFDPVTLGHLDLIERALPLFERVIVAVGVNTQKRPIFTAEERVEMLREALPESAKLTVVTFTGLVVDYCREHGVGAILRGLRTVSDFESEYQMALTNQHMEPKIESVFMMPSPQFSYVSSSLIREIVRCGGDARSFLPESVEQRLRDRLS